MILKKPYAFLIKHFRIIHLILLIPMIYITIKIGNIANFFNSYVKNGYSAINVMLSELVGNYLNIFMFLGIILILATLIIITFILQKKDKPTRFYKISIIYYLLIFIMLIASFSIFNMIQNDTIDAVMTRLVRDLSFLIFYSQFIFIIYTFIRGIGFNIRKFNFQSDLEDLEISSEDSEEFEFMVGIDTYKTKRTIHRFFRELKYYYKENKFIFTIIIVILVIIIASSLYMNREVNHVYKENDTISFNYFNFKVNKSYLTTKTLSGQTLNKDKAYLVLQINLINNFYEDKEFNYNNIQLLVNKKLVKPNISLGNYFTDFGYPFSGTFVTANSDNSYIFVYEIDKYLINSNFKIVTFNQVTDTKGKYINIKPTKLNDNITNNNVNMNSNINLSGNLGKSSINIKDYEITSHFEYTYKYCVTSNNCFDSKANIPMDFSKNVLLVLDFDLALDDESSYMYYKKDYKKFFEDFLQIKYTVNGVDYYEAVSSVNPNNYNDKFVTEISKKINLADKIEALILKKYL